MVPLTPLFGSAEELVDSAPVHQTPDELEAAENNGEWGGAEVDVKPAAGAIATKNAHAKRTTVTTMVIALKSLLPLPPCLPGLRTIDSTVIPEF